MTVVIAVLELLIVSCIAFVQLFNRVPRRVRVPVSLIGFSALGLLVVVAPESWKVVAISLGALVFLLNLRWGFEVEHDEEIRPSHGQPPLMDGHGGQRIYYDPIYMYRYRHKMFRDRFSFSYRMAAAGTVFGLLPEYELDEDMRRLIKHRPVSDAKFLQLVEQWTANGVPRGDFGW